MRDEPPALERSLINQQAHLIAVMGLRGYSRDEIDTVSRLVLLAELGIAARADRRKPTKTDESPEDWRDIRWSDLP